jgi:hypothetical protein
MNSHLQRDLIKAIDVKKEDNINKIFEDAKKKKYFIKCV